MKNTKHIMLAGTMSVILAACGGGGSGSPSTSSTDTAKVQPPTSQAANPATHNSGTTPTTNSQTTQKSNGSEVPQTANNQAEIKKNDGSDAAKATDNQAATQKTDDNAAKTTADKQSAAQTPNPSNNTQTPAAPIILKTHDGTYINLSSGPKGAVEAKTDNGRIIGHNYTHSFYGVWVDNSKQLRGLHVHGNETPISSVPTSGSATYYGNAARLDSLTDSVLTDATSRINIDFGRKTVKGEITMPGARRDITLHEGRLNGASYSGQASVIGNQSGLYEGKIYGPNANETAGMVKFRSNSDLDTVFGGKRY